MLLASAVALMIWRFLTALVWQLIRHRQVGCGLRAVYAESAESFWLAGVLSIVVGLVLLKLAVAKP